MTNGKLNRKYYPIIWVGLLIACFVSNAYAIYTRVQASPPQSSIGTFLLILRYFFTYGAVPTAVTVLCAFVVWHIGAFRYVRYVPRTDFCYLVMAGVAVSKFAVGIIDVFSILEPTLHIVTSQLLHFTVLTAVLFALYFFVIAKQYNFNPVEKYNSFKMWSIVYMTVLGLSVLSTSVATLAAVDGGDASFIIWMIMDELEYTVEISDLQVGVSIASMCIYAVYLIGDIVLAEMMRKKAEQFRNPETRGDYYDKFENRSYKLREDADKVFDGSQQSVGGQPEGKKSDENVFDEFDI